VNGLESLKGSCNVEVPCKYSNIIKTITAIIITITIIGIIFDTINEMLTSGSRGRGEGG